MSALLLYSSRDGHTQRIMQVIAQSLAGKLVCEVADLHQLSAPDWTGYQQIIIGAAIRYGHFHPLLWRFVNAHHATLSQRLSAFFCVSLVARKLEKRTATTNPYLRKFLARSPWQPTQCAAFAGALYYPRYHWFDRRLIQLIMALTRGETDTCKEVEYTDWQQVKQFADQFAALHSNRGE